MYPEIARQLNRRNIDAIFVKDLGKLGDSDDNHLRRAAEMSYVLCTHDQDFLRMHNEGIEHAGIIFGQQRRTTISTWVRKLIEYHEQIASEEMKNRLIYLPAQ